MTQHHISDAEYAAALIAGRAQANGRKGGRLRKAPLVAKGPARREGPVATMAKRIAVVAKHRKPKGRR
jgi:hypothetical protein